MKKHYLFFIEFVFLCSLCLIPPLLTPLSSSYHPQIDFSSISLQQLVFLLIGILLYLQQKDSFFTPFAIPAMENSRTKMGFILYSGFFLLAFGELTVSASLIEFAAQTVGRGKYDLPSLPALPHHFTEYVICILIFLSSAFYEEAMYRMYLPAMLAKICHIKLSVRMSTIVAEITAAVLFALSHRYLGYFAVVNAACAAVFLRICYRKSGSIFPGILAHFIYNIMMLFLMGL